jgi:hypothetical protein
VYHVKGLSTYIEWIPSRYVDAEREAKQGTVIETEALTGETALAPFVAKSS